MKPISNLFSLCLFLLLPRRGNGNTCNVPKGKQGPKDFVTLQIYLCKKSTRDLKTKCKMEGTTAPLVKNRKTYMKQMNNSPLVAMFYGEDICLSWVYRWQIKSSGREDVNMYSCKSICFAYDKDYVERDSSERVFHFKTVCSTPNRCKLVYHRYKFVIEASQSPFCPLPTLEDRPKKSILLRLEHCSFTTSDSKTVCEPHYNTKLGRDQEQQLGFSANGVNVMARYFGQETCISFMYRHQVNEEIYYKCQHICSNLTNEEPLIYSYHVFCSYESCGEKYYTLRVRSDESFNLLSSEKSTNGNDATQVIIDIMVLITCSLITLTTQST